MQLNGHDALDFWPIALVAGTGLIAWGRIGAKVEGMRKDVDTKASTERVDAIDSQLKSIDGKLDSLVVHLLKN